MITPARIGYVLPDGGIRSVWVSMAGQPDHTGTLLSAYYQAARDICLLVESGYIIMLGDSIKSTTFSAAYHPIDSTSISDWVTNVSTREEYMYLYQSGVWIQMSQLQRGPDLRPTQSDTESVPATLVLDALLQSQGRSARPVTQHDT